MRSRLLLATPLAALLHLCTPAPTSASSWRPLFNGANYDGWRHWLGTPHRNSDVPGLERDAAGNYTSVIGWDRDPQGNFKVVEMDGGPVMYFSGEGMGYALTTEVFSDFHLRIEFKWGRKKWPPRETAVRDSGLLYHVRGEAGRSSRVWPASVELQIQEGDCGDLYSIISQITVRARTEPLPGDNPNNRLRYIYDPAGEPFLFEQRLPVNNRCIKSADFEKPSGEWNTIELVCLGADSIHIVNGHVVMRLTGARQREGENWVALTGGAIALQSEGAEVYYRNIAIRPITAVPPPYATP